MGAQRLPELPTGYYLDNFERLCRTAVEQYGDLLTAAEQAFWQDFQRCSRAARRLYVRLISRRGSLFRSDKLHYAEIGDLDAAADELAEHDLLSIDPPVTLHDIAALLTKAELRAAFADTLALPANARKPELVAHLQTHYGDAPRPWTRWPLSPARGYRLQRSETLTVFRLLFFGNLQQDLHEFTLTDLGLYRYEDYPLEQAQRYFTERPMIDAALQLHQLSEQLEQALLSPSPVDLAPLVEQLPAAYPWPLLERRRSRLLNRLARELERRQQWQQALALYAQSTVAPGPERRIRVLDKLGRSAEALRLCEQLAQQCSEVTEQEFCALYLPKLRRKLGGPKVTRRSESFRTAHLTLPPGPATVELAALDHYRCRGYDGAYVENLLLNGLFGLALWDLIFMPLPGAFFNRYQRGPLDLFTSDFYRQRQSAIEQRLTELVPLTPAQLEQQLLARWHQKQGINNALINWTRLDAALIRQACRHIPASHLVAIFRQMSFDLRTYRSGFPDLVLFTDSAERYRLVEVKGPGDALQTSQKRWLRLFEQHGIPYEIAYVSYQVPV